MADNAKIQAEAKIKVGLVGITGYTGMELARILATHPQMELVLASSRNMTGKRLADIYPFLTNLSGANVPIQEFSAQEIASQCQIVFLAVPHSTSMQMAAELLDAGCKVIDLSADFRLNDPSVYEQWYGKHSQADLLKQAVYGLPELYQEQIKQTRLLANPGCYPTVSILSLVPALEADLIERDSIIIDAKSGTSGAGRSANVPTLFCEVQDTFRAYSVAGKHRHIPEIEQELSKVAKQEIKISFTPHLVPMQRGILATIYAKLKDQNLELEAIRQIYQTKWSKSPWIRLLPTGNLPETRFVRGSMFCDLAITKDDRCGRLILVAAIDNLCRGASGQAIANANLMSGLDLDCGLKTSPLMP